MSHVLVLLIYHVILVNNVTYQNKKFSNLIYKFITHKKKSNRMIEMYIYFMSIVMRQRTHMLDTHLSGGTHLL